MAAKKHDKSAPAQDHLLDGPALFARFLRLTEKWSDVNRLHEWPVSNAYLSQLRSGKLDPAKMRSSTLAKLRIAVREVERRQAFEAAYVASQPAAPAGATVAPAAPAAPDAFEHAFVPGQSSSEAPFIEHVLYMAGRIAELAHQIQVASQRQMGHLEQLATAAAQQQALTAEEIARVQHAAAVTSSAATSAAARRAGAKPPAATRPHTRPRRRT